MVAASKTLKIDLDAFVEKLLHEKGLATMTPELVNEAKKDLMARIEDYVNATIVKHMPPEKMKDFEQIIDQSDEREIYVFCARHIHAFDEVIAQALLAFRHRYLNP